MFQFFQLLPTLTALENVVMPMDFARVHSPRDRRDKAMSLLERFDAWQTRRARRQTCFPAASSFVVSGALIDDRRCDPGQGQSLLARSLGG